LNVGATEVTDNGIKELQESLPKCAIMREPSVYFRTALRDQ
jgi:hypothetical protein